MRWANEDRITFTDIGTPEWRAGTARGAIREREACEEEADRAAGLAYEKSGVEYSTEAMGLSVQASRHRARINSLRNRGSI